MLMRFISPLIFCIWSLTNAAHAAEVGRGEVEFTGFVTDNASRWLWRIASPEQIWDVDVADAVRDAQDNQTFSLGNKGTLPFLEGYLKEIAGHGRAGMMPVVEFSSNGSPLTVISGDISASGFRSYVPVQDADTGIEVGKLSFTLEQGLLISQGRSSSEESIPGMTTAALASKGDISTSLATRLLALLAMNGGAASAQVPLTYKGERVSPNILTDSSKTNLAAAWASQLSDFSLSWPQDKVPIRWQAKLNVMVTLQ